MNYRGSIFSNGIFNLSKIFLASGEAEVTDYWNNSLNDSPFANKLIDYLKNEKEFLE